MAEHGSGVRLPLPLRDTLDVYVDEEAIHRIHGGVKRRRARPRRRVGGGLVAVAAAAVVALAFGIYQIGTDGTSTAPGPLRLSDGALPASFPSAADDVPVRTVLSDGSAVYVHAGAELETLENTGRTFVVHLRAGLVELDVVPDGPRRWTVECGEVSVQVVGTRFSVDRSEERIAVSVERGAVLVRGDRVPDRVRRLDAGEALDVPLVDSIEPDVVEVEIEPAAAEAPLPSEALPSEALPSEALPSEALPSWRELARRGAYDEAYDSLGSAGLGAATERATVQDLLALADVARLSGHPAESVAPLNRLLNEHAGTPHAPLAAFTLGRVQLDSLGDPAAAAEAFERALTLGLPNNLQADALGRLAEAHRRSGDTTGARRAAARYVATFPDGNRADAMRRIVAAESAP